MSWAVLFIKAGVALITAMYGCFALLTFCWFIGALARGEEWLWPIWGGVFLFCAGATYVLAVILYVITRKPGAHHEDGPLLPARRRQRNF